MVTVTRITSDFMTYVGAPRRLPPHDEAIVERIWRRALRDSDSLHDGRILTVSSIRATGIVVSAVHYRYWFAQFTAGLALGIHPLAITGVLRLAEGFLMGRRSDALLEDGGLWEFAPSGGVPAPDDESTRVINPYDQLVVEAQEELNLEASDLGEGEPFAIAENERTGVVDLAYLQRPVVDFTTLGSRAASALDREYAGLQVVTAPWRGIVNERLSPVAKAISMELWRHKLEGE